MKAKCPRCGAVLRVPKGAAGRKLACPKCGKHIRLALPRPETAAKPQSLPTKPKEAVEEIIDDVLASPEPVEASPRPEIPLAEDNDPWLSEDEATRKAALPPTRRAATQTLCPYCQEKISVGAIKCRYCREVLRPDEYSPVASGRDGQGADGDPAIREASGMKITAGIMGILLGGLGIHKFILGISSGLIMLLVSLLTLGLGAIPMGIIGLIEGIIYLTKSDEDFYETYVIQKKRWF